MRLAYVFFSLKSCKHGYPSLFQKDKSQDWNIDRIDDKYVRNWARGLYVSFRSSHPVNELTTPGDSDVILSTIVNAAMLEVYYRLSTLRRK